MTRITLLLLALLAACALSLVTSQHQARKLFAGLEREEARAKALDVEWGQLQLEARTWALPSRIERLAQERLRMRAPDPRRMHLLERDRLSDRRSDRLSDRLSDPLPAREGGR